MSRFRDRLPVPLPRLRRSQSHRTGPARGTWQGIIEDYFGVASQSDPPLWSSAVAVTKQALTAVGGFPVGVALGEDLLTWARLAARFPIAYATTPSAVFWRPTVTQSSSQTWQTPDRDDPVGQGLAELLTQGNAWGKKSLLRYIGLWHRMRGICWIGPMTWAAPGRSFAKRAITWMDAQAVDLHAVDAAFVAGRAVGPLQLCCDGSGIQRTPRGNLWHRRRGGLVNSHVADRHHARGLSAVLAGASASTGGSRRLRDAQLLVIEAISSGLGNYAFAGGTQNGSLRWMRLYESGDLASLPPSEVSARCGRRWSAPGRMR